MASTSPRITPKRKRWDVEFMSPIKFSFEPPTASALVDPEDGSSSPRSTVAHKFRGLALESGGGASSNDDEDRDVSEGSPRKRQRPDEMMLDDPPAEAGGAVAGLNEIETVAIPPFQLSVEESQVEAAKDPESPKAGASLQRAYPSINRLSDSKSRVKKRSSSPPLRFKRVPRRLGDDDAEIEIVDPVRAALTWHEDEITIYDPEDEDDDGIGINGIGFKPTPALAHARAMKRRQQMAEYRKREESEARAKRSQRRRGGGAITIRPEDKSPSRKVRFTEAEAKNIAITTG